MQSSNDDGRSTIRSVRRLHMLQSRCLPWPPRWRSLAPASPPASSPATIETAAPPLAEATADHCGRGHHWHGHPCRVSSTATAAWCTITSDGLGAQAGAARRPSARRRQVRGRRFTSAGGHFDPGPAGNTDPDANHPYHMGDLPNLEGRRRRQGRARCASTTRVTLDRRAADALRRRRHGDHHPRQPRSGHHRRAEVGRQRRTAGRLRRDLREAMSSSCARARYESQQPRAGRLGTSSASVSSPVAPFNDQHARRRTAAP